MRATRRKAREHLHRATRRSYDSLPPPHLLGTDLWQQYSELGGLDAMNSGTWRRSPSSTATCHSTSGIIRRRDQPCTVPERVPDVEGCRAGDSGRSSTLACIAVKRPAPLKSAISRI